LKSRGQKLWREKSIPGEGLSFRIAAANKSSGERVSSWEVKRGGPILLTHERGKWISFTQSKEGNPGRGTLGKNPSKKETSPRGKKKKIKGEFLYHTFNLKGA